MPSISDEIRLALDKPDGVSEEIMTPLAVQYDQLVGAVNERLDEAVMLLRKNLRSEAIQSANRRPNVIDAAATLDFPEIAEWYEILQFLGVKLPRRLDLEKIQQINEAIVEEQPIEELLRQHRRLAIARAPLNWRLAVLRRIAESDPMNPAWMDDIESYERERLKTLRTDVEAALKEDDLNTIHHLFSELTKQAWVSEVPSDLAVSLQKAIKQHEYDNQVEELRGLSADLHEAFSGFDEPRARTLLANWKSKCSALKGPVPADLQQDVAPTEAWLNELDEYALISQQRDAVLQKLEDALDRERDPSRLHKAYAAATRFDEPVPPDLAQRYQALQDQIALNAKRKTQFKLGSVIAATLLIAVLIGGWQLSAMRAAKVAETVASFKKLVDDNRVTEAQAFWDKTVVMDVTLTQVPEMLQLHETLVSMVNAEKTRQNEFKSYLSKADSEDSSTIDAKALGEAERLAKTEEEKAQVFAVQEKLDAYLKKLTKEQTEKALEEIKGIRDRVAKIEKLEFEEIDGDELSELMGPLRELSRLYPRRSSEVDAQAKLVLTKLENLEDSYNEIRRAEMLRQQARRPLEEARSLSAYQKAIDRYSRVVNPSLASELTRSASESSLWDKGYKTNKLASDAAKLVVDGLQPEDVSPLVSAVAQLRAESGVNPILDDFLEISNLIESAAEARAEALNTLNERLARKPFKDLVTVLTEDADSEEVRAYLMYLQDYSRNAAQLQKEGPGQMGIKRIANVNGGITTSVVKFPMERAHVEPGATMEWLTKQLQVQKNDLETSFELTLIRMARELTKRIDLDQKIKEELLHLVLQCAVDGSVVMAERLGDASLLLRGRITDRALWFEPSVPNDQLDPEVVEGVVSVLEMADADLPDAEQLLRAASSKRYTFCGFIDRDQTGTLKPLINQNPEDDSACYVMVAAVSDPTKVDVIKVGQWQKGQLEVDLSSADVVAGRPLFFISE